MDKDKPRRDTNAARPRKSHRYWKEAIEEGKLTGPELAYAIKQIEKHEKPKRAEQQLKPEEQGRIAQTHSGTIAWAEDCIRKGFFQGTVNELLTAMRKDTELGGHYSFLDPLTPEEQGIPSDDTYWTSDRNPRPHGKPVVSSRSEEDNQRSRRILDWALGKEPSI